jgi:L-lactate dehydrogenase
VEGVFFMNNKGVKISIIGAGFCGSTIAFSIMNSGLASEIVIVDINKDKAFGRSYGLISWCIFC